MAVALGLIVVAIGGLALFEQFRQPPAVSRPPHEPAEALIAPPQPVAAETAAPTESPPPPQVSDNAALPPGPTAQTSTASDAGKPEPKAIQGKAYLVQVGVFNSTKNAQALQKRLVKAGIPAQTETRVQIGPFKDKREAEKALAKAKKLGINAVLLPSRQ